MDDLRPGLSCYGSALSPLKPIDQSSGIPPLSLLSRNVMSSNTTDRPAVRASCQTAAVGEKGDAASILRVGCVRRGGVEACVRLDERPRAPGGPTAGRAVLLGPDCGQDPCSRGLSRPTHGAGATRLAACRRLVVALVA